MRLFENLALLSMVLILAWTFAPEKRRARAILFAPIATWILLAVHFIVEGVRWQMIPGYVMAIGLTLNNFRLLARKKPFQESSRIFRFIVLIIAIIAFLAIYQLPQLIPVFALPAPGVQYSVGSISIILEDPSREETLTENQQDNREIPLRIWYPAEPEANAKPSSYWSGHPEYSRYLTAELGLPAFLLDHLKLVKTNSFLGLPLAARAEKFPVIIFQHGYRLGYLEQNTSLMETLASNGFVVISLAHPYEAIAVPLVDGSTARYNVSTDVFMESPALQELSLKRWAADTLYLMDQLEGNLSGGPLAILNGHIDSERLGLAGMSFGGSTSSLVCLTDSRCKAGLTLDSPQYSAVKAGQLSQPFLFMVSDNGNYLEQNVYEETAGPAYLVTVAGAKHYNFTDLTLVSPLASAFNLSGPIIGQQMVRIINAYSLAFFNKHLKDLSSPLLNGISAEFPEVSIESRNSR